MLPPYLYLHQCGEVLLAASPSRLDFFHIDDGSQLTSWNTSALLKEDSIGNFNPAGGNIKDFEPRAKRRKRSSTHDVADTVFDEVTIHNSKQYNSNLDKQETPAITALTSTRNGDHVIVLTGEDKSIRVFKHDGRGHLQCMSQRIMPKRPCAVALTSDDTTIVCGDKFGDVYSIPLLFSRSSADPQQHGSSTQTEYVATKSSTPFVPAANDLTVHSIRNRKALQNQLKQKHDATQKSELQFEHKLLLGHVSMLTDIALIQRNGKSYIITADRDEHIRFSRGIPQAHIIEGYCLGHTEFVSRLCFPAGRPNLLISGGGDDEIYVWDWCLGKLIHKVNVKIHIQRLMTYIEKAPAADNEVSKLNIPSSETVKMAVSNIEYVSGTLQQHDDLIMVTCEGIPAIFIFSFQDNSAISHYQTLKLDGNPLGLIIDSGSKSFIVSIDGIHKPGSIIQLRTDRDAAVEVLQCFQNFTSEWVNSQLRFRTGPEVTTPLSGDDAHGAGEFTDLLYPLQKLRKAGCED